jgi:hypothetical protein
MLPRQFDGSLQALELDKVSVKPLSSIMPSLSESKSPSGTLKWSHELPLPFDISKSQTQMKISKWQMKKMI